MQILYMCHFGVFSIIFYEMVIFRYNILVVKIVYWEFSEGHSVKWVFCRILFCIEGYGQRYYESAWCSWWVVFGVVVSCVVAYIVVSCY